MNKAGRSGSIANNVTTAITGRTTLGVFLLDGTVLIGLGLARRKGR